MYTSLWNQEACILREGVYQIKSEGVKVPEKYFSPLKMVIFRTLMMCFGRTSRTAYFIKRIIRKLLITPSKSSRYSSVRSIKFESGTWSVLDTIHGTQERDRVYWGGEFIVRYVPQSKYVSHKDSSFFMKEVFVENNDVIEIFETISVEGDC